MIMKWEVIFFMLWGWVTSAKCSDPVQRKEIRELTEEELTTFISAINKLHETPSCCRRGASRHDDFARMHVDFNRQTHFTAAFLPWHRHYIRLWEKELQKIEPSVVLPYWDWSLDAQEPHNSPILSDKMFGGNGDRRRNYCLRKGPFKNWSMSVPRRHCLRREYNRGDKITSFAPPEAIILDLNEPRYSIFKNRFEVKHGQPHNSIGGRSGDLTPMHSPNDPLFFLHHAFIDLIWAEWQSRHPNSNQYDGERWISLRDTLPPFEIKVRDTLDTEEEFYCYHYQRYPRPVFKSNTSKAQRRNLEELFNQNPFVSGREANMTLADFMDSSKRTKLSFNNLRLKYGISPKINQPEPLSPEFINMNGFDFKRVREVEAKNLLLTNALNQNPNFVSLSQLSNYVNNQ